VSSHDAEETKHTSDIPTSPNNSVFDEGDAVPRRFWSFWNIIPWAVAAILLVLAVGISRQFRTASSELTQDRADEKALRAKITQLEKSGPQPKQSESAVAQEEADLQATIVQLRHSLDEANTQKDEAERQAARLQTELTAENLRDAALQKTMKDAEVRRVTSDAEAASMHAQVTKAQESAHRLALLSAQNDQLARLLESPSLHQLILKKVSAGEGDADARVVWDDDRGLMLLAHNLPDLPDDRVFQLWITRNRPPTMVKAGIVQIGPHGRGTVFVPPSEDLKAMTGVAISDEPDGSGTSMRGTAVLVGTL
jgi:hypothetical protein